MYAYLPNENGDIISTPNNEIVCPAKSILILSLARKRMVVP